MKTIGLFGTCGASKWRDDFISKYENLSINFYNPQFENEKWSIELADDETFHFNNDDIVLFPITNKTPALGSLAEVGFSILSIISSKCNDRYFIIFIDDYCISGDILSVINYQASKLHPIGCKP